MGFFLFKKGIAVIIKEKCRYNKEGGKRVMIEVENMPAAQALFGDWKETIIWSCLQKIMGHVYGDSAKNPKSVMAILGDFCFFAGEPKRELVQFKPISCVQDFIIMVPQNKKWADCIEKTYGEKAKRVTRYAIKKEKDNFHVKRLQAVVESLNSEYEIHRIDKKIYDFCIQNNWSRDLVSQYKSYEEYKKLGIGVIITKNGIPVSGASAYSRYRDGIEIEIDTDKSYRRRGLAYVCGAKLILECLQCNLYPSWDAQNQWSVALAEKLGYHYDKEYAAYEIWGWGTPK